MNVTDSVRFLDNFSAASAEYFLKAGYAFIFMHRQFSLQPFSRQHYSHFHPFLDFLEVHPSSAPDATIADTEVKVTQRVVPALLPIFDAYKRTVSEGLLHMLTFVTGDDYLYLLRGVSKEMGVLGRNRMLYLAAAVSDFFLPRNKMGSLIIEMDQVPKVLKPVVAEWAREGFVVSFKLETDATLLVPKAQAELERYRHQVVIGNDLQTRKWEVVFVSQSESQPTTTSTKQGEGFETAEVKEIEEDIVKELEERYGRWIELNE
ncbi:DNA/pantothenate metabolism flavo protein [Athelia psychrophila]|uniref:DNA/pantothenate metabolism flavo protein n=1 Tax=Athelia psychrophila TaxID=1759441 RepID=A0A165X4C4_9AGAM|nr:DNA/pantothenate metabolism flavo protein [Fibularhizoctonia sp. CBS 109695]